MLASGVGATANFSPQFIEKIKKEKGYEKVGLVG
jgi:hypothetical protein